MKELNGNLELKNTVPEMENSIDLRWQKNPWTWRINRNYSISSTEGEKTMKKMNKASESRSTLSVPTHMWRDSQKEETEKDRYLKK